MQKIEFRMFLASLDQVAEVLGTTLSATKKEGYWLSLQDLTLESFQGACLLAMRHETFFPVPAVLRDYAKVWHQEQRAIPHPSSMQELLAIRESLISDEEIRALIASVWPSEGNGGEPLYEPPSQE